MGQVVVVEIPGQDWVELSFRQKVDSKVDLNVDPNIGILAPSKTSFWHLRLIGCSEVIHLGQALKSQLHLNPQQWTLPTGGSHGAILFRELILKARGEWNLPYKEQEICHCRKIPRSLVEGQISTGVFSVTEITRRTQAGAGCGTCRRDIQQLIDYKIPKI